MWYFSWMLGLPLAAGFAVINAMWYELTEDRLIEQKRSQYYYAAENNI